MVARLSSLAALLSLLCLSLPAPAGAALPVKVRRVIADFRNDGRIEPCRHTAKTYRDTLKAIEADTNQYAPDFPIAVEAAEEARADTDCKEEEEAAASPTPTPTPTSTPTAPSPTATPAPIVPATPVVPVAPVAPVTPTDPPATEASPSPSPSPTVSPEAEAPPAPTAVPGSGAGITPGVPPATTNKPDVVLARTADHRGARLPLAILAGLLAAALLAGLLALLMRRFGWGAERLAGVRHSWGEASYRTGGTWQNFTDWLRLGR